MVTDARLLDAVEASFRVTARGLRHWPDPHPGRDPRDEEYSRISDPAKWRIVAARAEAWCDGLVRLGLASLDRDVAATWPGPAPHPARVARLTPVARGALPLSVSFRRVEGADENFVAIGVGDPIVEIDLVPDCGCDACDSGSRAELDALDDVFLHVVSGGLRHLRRGSRRILTCRGGWSASGSFGRGEVDAVLADPSGWVEASGRPWATA